MPKRKNSRKWKITGWMEGKEKISLSIKSTRPQSSTSWASLFYRLKTKFRTTVSKSSFTCFIFLWKKPCKKSRKITPTVKCTMPLNYRWCLIPSCETICWWTIMIFSPILQLHPKPFTTLEGGSTSTSSPIKASSTTSEDSEVDLIKVI